jgi:DNA excision repair protein ERCC-4
MEINKSTVELKIDFRERTASRRKFIEELPDSFTVHYTQLPVGDYVIDNKIIVERKTFEDFRASVRDGRIFRQAYRMASAKMPGLMVIEGDSTVQDEHPFDRHAFLGVMVHLSVILGIPVIASSDYRETLFIFASIARQLESLKEKRGRVYGKKPYPTGYSRVNRIRIALLQTIPNVGTHKAVSLLREFGSLRNIVLAGEGELMKADGIGNKISNSILSLLQGEVGRL